MACNEGFFLEKCHFDCANSIIFPQRYIHGYSKILFFVVQWTRWAVRCLKRVLPIKVKSKFIQFLPLKKKFSRCRRYASKSVPRSSVPWYNATAFPYLICQLFSTLIPNILLCRLLNEHCFWTFTTLTVGILTRWALLSSVPGSTFSSYSSAILSKEVGVTTLIWRLFVGILSHLIFITFFSTGIGVLSSGLGFLIIDPVE